jgi:hypothetical protein
MMVEHDGRTDVAFVRETASALLWMGERTFYVLARSDPAPEEYHALADRLHVVWARALQISDRPGGAT